MRGHVRKRTKTGADGKPKTYWYVVVDIGIDEHGKRRQKWHSGFKTRRAAESAAADLVKRLEEKSYVEPRRMTLATYARDEWLPMMKQQLKASTFHSYTRVLELHVLPTLGSRQLQAISPGHLNALYRQLLESGRRNGKPGRGLSAKTVRYVHTTVSKLFNDAVDQELVVRNPAERSKPPRAPKGTSSMRFWTPEQLASFLAYTRDHRWSLLWRLAAMTGMRRGEVVGIRWQDIDFTNARLSVRQTLLSIAYKIEFSTPKSHRSRVIDIDQTTLEALRDAHAIRNKRSAHDLVFIDENGNPLHPESVRVVFERLITHVDVPRIRFHDLRHTHATIALRAGVPIKVISERLGHSTPAFTLTQYAHVIPGMQAEAAQQVADLVDADPETDADDDAEDPSV